MHILLQVFFGLVLGVFAVAAVLTAFHLIIQFLYRDENKDRDCTSIHCPECNDKDECDK